MSHGFGIANAIPYKKDPDTIKFGVFLFLETTLVVSNPCDNYFKASKIISARKITARIQVTTGISFAFLPAHFAIT